MTRRELDDLTLALSEVYSGADRQDAEAVADHLEDLGWVGLRAAPPVRPVQPVLPVASTAGLVKRRSAG